MLRRLPLIVLAIGIVLMAIGTFQYVVGLNWSYETVFIIGFILMVVPYAYIMYDNLTARKNLETEENKEDRDGYLIVLDEDYVPTEQTTEIIDLDRE